MLHSIDRFPEDTSSRQKQLSQMPTIHPTCVITNSRVGEWTDLGAHTRFNEVTFDDYSYAVGNVSIAHATIGKFCSIANSVRINPGNHPQWRVTQHHCTYRRIQYGFDSVEDESFFQWRRDHHCTVGHDVWIGHGAVIMPGVQVGTGAIIGTGAVVTKNVAPYEVVVGVPAQVIKRRFAENVAEKLLAIAWWEWDRPTLEARFEELLHVESFIKKYFSPEKVS